MCRWCVCVCVCGTVASNGLRFDRSISHSGANPFTLYKEFVILRNYYFMTISSPAKQQKADLSVPIPPAPPGNTCAKYLPTKRRYCRVIPAAGRLYCGQHAVDRVPCLLDPSHSVLPEDMPKHLLRCNETWKQRRLQEFSRLDLNVRDPTASSSSSSPAITMTTITHEHFDRLLKSIDMLYEKYQHLIPIKPIDPSVQIPSQSAYHAECIASTQNHKHIEQVNSLVYHLRSHFPIDEDVDYLMEFGCGRAMLSAHLFHALPPSDHRAFLLIDRGTQAKRFDPELPHARRIQIDIKDLDLPKVPEYLHAKRLLCYSKHLCGAATDLTLRCVLERRMAAGFGIALCCHQACTFATYNTPQLFLDHGLDSNDFALISNMSSWAVCGFEMANDEHLPESGAPPAARLRSSEKRLLGWKCKRVIDIGRVMYLTEHGYACEFIEYVGTELSPENLMLIARRK